MLVLKRVADARRDGDEILAVIAGSAVNHDGRSNGLLAPNPDAQEAVLRKAYKDAGIDPRTVDYVEAHGTGTILGDPIEADALGRVIGRGRAADQPALLGAVKSNVGHLESAAGAASLAKVALSLLQRQDAAVDQLHRAQPVHRLRQGTPQGRRHRHRLAALQRSRDRGRVRVRLRRRERPPRGARGAAVRSRRARARTRSAVVEVTAKPTPHAVYVGGVRMDEYGEFIDERRGSMTTRLDAIRPLRRRRARTARADRRGAAPAGGRPRGAGRRAGRDPAKPLVPLAVSAFLTSRKRATAAELADWIDSPEGRASSLESIGRSLSQAQPRPVPRGGAGPRPRRGDQGPACAGRRQAEPAGARRRRSGHQRPGVGAGRIRCAAPQDGQEPVSARRDLRRVDQQGRRAGPGRARVLRSSS